MKVRPKVRLPELALYGQRLELRLDSPRGELVQVARIDNQITGGWRLSTIWGTPMTASGHTRRDAIYAYISKYVERDHARR